MRLHYHTLDECEMLDTLATNLTVKLTCFCLPSDDFTDKVPCACAYICSSLQVEAETLKCLLPLVFTCQDGLTLLACAGHHSS